MVVLNEDFNFKSVQDALEQAGLFFYRLEKLANTALVINSFKDGEFKNPIYKEECVYYQLELIRDLAKQFETLFDEGAMTFGRQIDLNIKEVKN